mgnify:CR=1 FL=1
MTKTKKQRRARQQAATHKDRKPTPTMVLRRCPVCGTEFQARTVDVKRGWGLFCSKSCKAKEQESRTHQHRNHLRTDHFRREYGGEPVFDRRGEYVGFMGLDPDHDCNKD